MYESPEQAEPQFDAKGIETVRRDNCPAVSKVTIASHMTVVRQQDAELFLSMIMPGVGEVPATTLLLPRPVSGQDLRAAPVQQAPGWQR